MAELGFYFSDGTETTGEILAPAVLELQLLPACVYLRLGSAASHRQTGKGDSVGLSWIPAELGTWGSDVLIAPLYACLVAVSKYLQAKQRGSLLFSTHAWHGMAWQGGHWTCLPEADTAMLAFCHLELVWGGIQIWQWWPMTNEPDLLLATSMGYLPGYNPNLA